MIQMWTSHFPYWETGELDAISLPLWFRSGATRVSSTHREHFFASAESTSVYLHRDGYARMLSAYPEWPDPNLSAHPGRDGGCRR